MTILARVVGPGYELTVCGNINSAWLEWLRAAEVPLTAAQHEWRQLMLEHDEHDGRRHGRATGERAHDSTQATPPR